MTTYWLTGRSEATLRPPVAASDSVKRYQHSTQQAAAATE